MNPTYLDSPHGTVLPPRRLGFGGCNSKFDSSLLREEAAPAASGTVGAAPETTAELAAWIEWDTRARRGVDQ